MREPAIILPVTAHPTAAFDRATTVRSRGDGRYEAELDPAWEAPFGPNGGYLAAVLLRATQAELEQPELTPRIVNIHYARAATSGPAELTVSVLRTGRRNATLQTSLQQDGKLICTALVTCSAPRPQPLTLTEAPPPVPPFEDVPELPAEAFDKLPRTFRRLHLRPCIGTAVWGGGGEAVTGGWVELRDDADQLYDAIRLVALTDLWWPAIFTAVRAPIGVPTLELSIYLRTTTPVPGPILARFETRTVREGHVEETGELWSAAGELLAQSRQLALVVDPPAKIPR